MQSCEAMVGHLSYSDYDSMGLLSFVGLLILLSGWGSIVSVQCSSTVTINLKKPGILQGNAQDPSPWRVRQTPYFVP